MTAVCSLQTGAGAVVLRYLRVVEPEAVAVVVLVLALGALWLAAEGRLAMAERRVAAAEARAAELRGELVQVVLAQRARSAEIEEQLRAHLGALPQAYSLDPSRPEGREAARLAHAGVAEADQLLRLHGGG